MEVNDILSNAGLKRLAPKFAGLSIEAFRSLLLQDYDSYGVIEMADKQALFRVIQELNAADESYVELALSRENSMTSLEITSPDRRNKIPTDSASHPHSDVSVQRASTSYVSKATDSGVDQVKDGSFDLSTVDSAGADEDLRDLEESMPDAGDFLGSGNDVDLQQFSREFVRSVTPERMFDSEVIGSKGTHPEGLVIKGNDRGRGSDDQQALHGAHIHQATRNEHVVGGSQNGNVTCLASISDAPRIRVIVRKRPLNSKEIEKGDTDVLECDSENAMLYVHEPKIKVDLTRYTECHEFRFDDVFDESVGNEELYCRAVQPLIATLFRRGRGTCFAYGQTGSGKTYTMQPLPLRAAADIFRVINSISEFSACSLYVSCFEIYGGRIYDLLNTRQRLEVREDGKKRVQVVGLKEFEVENLDLLMQLCNRAACTRSTGATGANDESSRSHSILTFSLRAPAPSAQGHGREKGGGSSDAAPKPRRLPPQQRNAAPPLQTIGKLSFIDLAGSERGADTFDNAKHTRLEGAEINKSLLALKECIRALDMEAGHIPFRGSKLTSVLRDSFMGKHARTVMIANVSPNSSSCEHTLNTLRYADRVKEIKKDGINGTVGKHEGTGGGIGGGQGGNGTRRTTNDEDGVGATAVEVAALLQNLPPPSLPAGIDPRSGQGHHGDLPHEGEAAAHKVQGTGMRSRPPPLSVLDDQGNTGNNKSQEGMRGDPSPSPLMSTRLRTPGSGALPTTYGASGRAQTGQPHQGTRHVAGMSAKSPGKALLARRGTTTPKKDPHVDDQRIRSTAAMGKDPPRVTSYSGPNERAVAAEKPVSAAMADPKPSNMRPRQSLAFSGGAKHSVAETSGDVRKGGQLSAHPLQETLSDSTNSAGTSEQWGHGQSIDSDSMRGGAAVATMQDLGGRSQGDHLHKNGPDWDGNVFLDVDGNEEDKPMTEGEAALLTAEDELICAHREHIERTMAGIRAEMDLLARLDDSADDGLSVEAYVEELNDALMDRSAEIAALLQQVTTFRRQLRAAMTQMKA